MWRVYRFVESLPDRCGQLTINELLLVAASVTLIVVVVLSASGRRLI